MTQLRSPLLALAIVALALPPGCAEHTASTEHIVLVVIDTLRRDHVSLYGGSRAATPTIDAIATRGQAHRNYVASFHQTSMSMGALFTGRTPSLETGDRTKPLDWNGRTWCGLARFAGPQGEAGCIPASVTTLGERLRGAGYWTAGVVSNRMMFRPAGFDRGMDEWIELTDERTIDAEGRRRSPGVRARQVNAAALDLLARRPEGRFFLYVHYMDVHDYMLRKTPYPRMVRVVDDAIGELMDDLEKRGLLEQTLVIVTSDHGETITERHLVQPGLGHFGNPSPEELLRLPLIVAPAALADTDTLLRSQDLGQLIAGLAGADDDPHDRGLSDRPDPQLEPDELFFSEARWQVYRKGRFKSAQRRSSSQHHLFDLDVDPTEAENVASQYPAIVKTHRRRMDDIAAGLSALRPPPSELTAEDERALRELGYLE